jgi:hypothetical protein
MDSRLSQISQRRIVAAIDGFVPERWREVVTSIELNTGLGDALGEYGAGVIELNPRALLGHEVMGTGSKRIDRLTRVLLHEWGHAIGEELSAETSPSWLALSGWIDLGWVEGNRTPPEWERCFDKRAAMLSPWAHRADAWFTRSYASLNPFEDWADCVLYVLAGWPHLFRVGGEEKLDFVTRMLDGAQSAAA